MLRNPVMFVVEIGSLLTTLLWLQALTGHGEAPASFILAVSCWLWFTVLFANFSEAIAEGRGKAQAEALRKARKETLAKKLSHPFSRANYNTVPSTSLLKDDVFLVEAGDTIAVDGEVVEGIASVDESAVTGESAPVIRESGGDRSAVTGGTRVLSDWLVIRVTANPGEGFLDRMIGFIEGAKRQKTPNEIALNILLAAFTIIFLVVCMTLLPYSMYSVETAGKGIPITITVLVALLVCLIPTTIGGLLSAIGIAGMDRMIQRNVIALSGRAVEAAGDVDVLLLDKTGTITLGNRQAVEFIPVGRVTPQELAAISQLSSLADETPEGRSIVVLAKEKFGLRGRAVVADLHHFVRFAAPARHLHDPERFSCHAHDAERRAEVHVPLRAVGQPRLHVVVEEALAGRRAVHPSAGKRHRAARAGHGLVGGLIALGRFEVHRQRPGLDARCRDEHLELRHYPLDRGIAVWRRTEPRVGGRQPSQ
jgi:K+-transporting ATPase ATPase B chain